MSNTDYSSAAGYALKYLIQEKYASQQAFAEDFGVELRTVNRYANSGIRNMGIVQEIAKFFEMDMLEFLQLAKELAEREAK